MSEDDEIEVRRLTEARTMSVHADPRLVVLEIKAADGDVRHYGLTVSELAELAKRLRADAALLGGAPSASGDPDSYES